MIPKRALPAFTLLLWACQWPSGAFSRELSADTLPGYQHPIRGTVYLDRNGNGIREREEPGLAGIAVSDGLDVVKTGGSGGYLLPNLQRKAVFAFVHQPGTVRQSGQDFFHLLPAGTGAVQFDFGLRPADADTSGGARFVQLSDSHVRNPSDRKYMLKATGEIYGMDPLPDFIVATGDLVDWGVDEHYRNYVAGMQEPPVPYFNVFGNHEIVFGPIGRYHRYIGPDYYSFERGGILFLSLNCVTPGERQAAWLKNTLKALAEGRPVVIFQHFPPGPEDLERFERLGVSAVFSGHWHSEKEMQHAGVQSVNSPPFIMGGIDASPAGFKVVQLDARGAATTGWRYGFQDKRVTVVSPQEGTAVNPDHLPLIVNAYDTSREIASVTWRLERENAPVDSGRLRRESATSWVGALRHSPASGEYPRGGEPSSAVPEGPR
ncbi:MAG TPA: metallophosphoesterase, partial [Anseongella sp.]|nr:metallophosphoesterase [Anseongella sp.]